MLNNTETQYWQYGNRWILYTDVSVLNQSISDFPTGVEVIRMEIPLPITHENEVVEVYAKVIDQSPEIKLAIIDHITSPSAIVIPVQKLVELCHQKGILVLVDAAHTPGQLKLDLEKLGADYYTGKIDSQLHLIAKYDGIKISHALEICYKVHVHPGIILNHFQDLTAYVSLPISYIKLNIKIGLSCENTMYTHKCRI